MKKFFLPFSFLLFFSVASSQQLKVSADGHYLQYADGNPFFWLANTGWELFHRLNLEEIENYLDNGSAKGFTVIQAVVLANLMTCANPTNMAMCPCTASPKRGVWHPAKSPHPLKGSFVVSLYLKYFVLN